MENAVVYARYSSHSQTEQSIEGQLNAARNYAEAKGYNIIREYCDRAKTGTNDNREEFQQMLSDCAKKQFSVIIVWKVDRFGRNREEITFNKYRAKKHGVRVEYVAESITDGPEGVILESVLEGMAEYYSLQLSQNIRRGKRESAKKLRIANGKPPLGYKRSEEGMYEIDPDNANIIRLIFKSYADGMSMSEIVTMLNDRGYRTSRGNAFGKNSLPRILRNTNYIGTFHFVDIVVEDAIPAIIDKETFDKVQEMLEVNQHRTVKHWIYGEYLLSGRMFCSKCGEVYIGESGTGKSGAKYCYYVCSTRHKDHSCNAPRLRKDFIEEKILDYVRNAVLIDEGIESLTNIILDYYANEDETEREVQHLKKEIEDVDFARSNILRAIESGLEYSIVEPRLNELITRRINLLGLLSKIELSRPLSLTREEIASFLEKFRDNKIQDRVCDKRLIETYVNSVLVQEGSIVLCLNIKEGVEPVFKNVVLPCVPDWSQEAYVRTVYKNTVSVVLPL